VRVDRAHRGHRHDGGAAAGRDAELDANRAVDAAGDREVERDKRDGNRANEQANKKDDDRGNEAGDDTMADDLADKTEAPTLHKRLEARRDGKIAHSGELSAAVMCLAALLLLQQTGPRVVIALQTLLVEGLSRPAGLELPHVLRLIAGSLAPLAVGLVLIALAANLLQTGFWFGFRRDTKVLDAVAGTQRIFSQRSVVAVAMSVAKLLIVAAVAFIAVRGQLNAIVSLQSRSSADTLPMGIAIVFAVAVRVVTALVILAVLDYAYQRYCHERELRMTRREVKDELRRQDGDPEIKRRRRGVAGALSAATLRVDVAGADVIVVDANDIAVALRYDPQSMDAPHVLAIGRGYIAQQVRNLAATSDIPLVERPTLAGAIAGSCNAGRDVPAKFHADVAEVLAYAYAIQGTDFSEDYAFGV
jgi:flagellar biosynthetic protein FlhB